MNRTSWSLRKFSNITFISVDRKALLFFVSPSAVGTDGYNTDEASQSVMRRRATCWLGNFATENTTWKRRLGTRPKYKAHRREMYREKTEEMKLLGMLPRKRGRPLMYAGPEALNMKRQRAREAAAHYRLKHISKLSKNNEATEIGKGRPQAALHHVSR